jgi:deoxyribodipyrimidine photo-lyase
VVPPGDLTPANGDHYKVFTPYWRAWRAVPWRPHYPAPDVIAIPKIEHIGRISPAAAAASPTLAKGGETEGRRRFLA